MLRLTSLLCAGLLATACAQTPDKKDTRTAAPGMDKEYASLPAGVVVRVPVDEDGNDQGAAETTLVDAQGESTVGGYAALDGGKSGKAGDWNVAFQGPVQTSKPSYDTSGASDYGAPETYGYSSDASYGAGWSYYNYTPWIFSQIVEGAAWVLSRPFVWIENGYRYYRWDRPSCGCYRQYDDGYGYNTGSYTGSSYTEVSIGKDGSSYQPTTYQGSPTYQGTPSYQAPTQTYVPQGK